MALCLVFVLSISAIAATTGGARYRHREHLDTWYDTADDNVPDNGFRTDVDTAYLYGNWYDRDLGFAGAYVSADKGTTLNIVLSSDFDFKRTEEGPWLTLCGGGIANDSEINGSTKVIVNGNRGAKIDLDNGGISIYGGGSHYWNRDNTSNISSAISGDSLVELKGESPEFILDEDERDNFNIYGGSAIGDKDIATTHIIYGGSGIVIESPWDLGDDDRDIGFVIGGSNVSGISKTITKGKTYVVLNNENASATNVRGGGRASDNSLCIVESGSQLLFKKGSIGNSYAGCYVSQNAKAYTANTNVEIRDINAPSDAMVTGGGVSGSNSDLDDTDMHPLSVVSGDTKILIEPSANYTGRGVCHIYGGSNIRGVGAMAEVRGDTNIIISGDAALNVIKPQDVDNTWAHISAGSFRKANTTVSNDVKGDGNITFKNIADISKLMHNTTLNGQGHTRKVDQGAELELYPNSVVGTSRLIFDNVKGTTSARTFQFDEIIFKNGSNMTFRHSLSQLYSDDDRDKETATLIVEKGSTLRIAPDTIDNTGDPVLGNAKIDGTLIVEDGMTLILNNSLEKGEGATVEGNIVVRKVNPEEPPIKPDDVNVIPVKPETVKSVDDLPAGVPALVEKQPNGDIVVTSAKFAAAVASSDVNGTVDTTLIKSIPVFKTVVSADKTALASFRGRLDEFSSHKFKDIVLCKVIPGKVLKFAFQSLPKKIESGEFAITTADGAAVEANASPKAGVEYLISFAVADNSEYDLDKTKGNILDPAVLSVNQYRLTLSATELLLAEGQSKTLTASGFAPGATLEWESSNDKVAAIEGSGEEITVKALSAGKANITVKDGSAAVTCRVTVTKGGSGGSSGGGCNSGLAAVVLAALIPLFFRRKSKAVH